MEIQFIYLFHFQLYLLSLVFMMSFYLSLTRSQHHLYHQLSMIEIDKNNSNLHTHLHLPFCFYMLFFSLNFKSLKVIFSISLTFSYKSC